MSADLKAYRLTLDAETRIASLAKPTSHRSIHIPSSIATLSKTANGSVNQLPVVNPKGQPATTVKTMSTIFMMKKWLGQFVGGAVQESFWRRPREIRLQLLCIQPHPLPLKLMTRHLRHRVPPPRPLFPPWPQPPQPQLTPPKSRLLFALTTMVIQTSTCPEFAKMEVAAILCDHPQTNATLRTTSLATTWQTCVRIVVILPRSWRQLPHHTPSMSQSIVRM
jgi:hypothetical protein